MFIVFPVGGLGNRMRVIDSTIRCCELNGIDYHVFWPYDAKMMACKWDDLFVSRPSFHNVNYLYKLFIHLNNLRHRLRFIKSILSLLEHKGIAFFCWIDDSQKQISLAESICKYKLVIVETYTAFYKPETEAFHADLFCLTEKLKKRVDEETRDFDTSTIGLHIRRTDNEDSIVYSPTRLFKDVIRQGTKTGKRFYLCSDDNTVKQEFLSEFGSQAVILPKGENLNRNTTDGIQQATVEMFALARTTKIYGSYYSSFSQIASLVGNNKLEILKLQ